MFQIDRIQELRRAGNFAEADYLHLQMHNAQGLTKYLWTPSLVEKVTKAYEDAMAKPKGKGGKTPRC